MFAYNNIPGLYNNISSKRMSKLDIYICPVGNQSLS